MNRLIYALFLIVASASTALAGDEEIMRPLQLTSGPVGPDYKPGVILSPAGWPSDFQPRDFPSILRDPALPNEPDGLLWRRMRSAHPGLKPLELLTQSPAELRRYLAASQDASGPDTVHMLALRVDFLQDGAGSGSTTLDGSFDLRHPDSARIAVDPPPHNRTYFERHMAAIARYFYKQSGGSLIIDWDLYPAQEDSAYHLNDTADYGPWDIAHGDEDLLSTAERFVRDAFAAADTSAEPPDFRKYESFVLIHAGADFQGDMNWDSPYDIPSFNIYLSDPVTVQDSTFAIDLIMVTPEQVSQDRFLGAANGVMVHEYGHQLGFYDLYNVLTFYPQVGMFSLHDSGDQLYGTVWDEYQEMYVFVRGAIPASCDPWQKMMFFPRGVRANWVSEDGQIKLPPVQLNNDIGLVPIVGQGVEEWVDEAHEIASEYFILENRPYDLNGDGMVLLESDDSTGVILGPDNLTQELCDSLEINCDSLGVEFPDTLGAYEQDYLLPGSGLLIWHIDNAALMDAFAICYGCVNVIPGRRAVDVEEADGIEDLGNAYSVEWTGGEFDYWFKGGLSRFGPDTDPNTASTAGGVTGISIEVMDDDPDSMSIAIELGPTRKGWPEYAGWPVGAEGITAFHLDRDDIAEIVAVGGKYLQMLNADGERLFNGPLVHESGRVITDSLLLPGVAATAGFQGMEGQATELIAAATNTRVLACDRAGTMLMRYPGGDEVLPELRFTTPPMMLDSIIVVGDSQGRLRGLLPGHVPEMLWRTLHPGYSVTAIAGGEIFEEEVQTLVWGDAIGRIFLATGYQQSGYIESSDWPKRLSSGEVAVRSILLIQGSIGQTGRILAVDDAATVALWDPYGQMMEGWPIDLDGTPAGPPAVGDPDGDGLLEIVLTTVDGQVHLLDLEGREEMGWPRSVWHPDATWRNPLATGPILVDLDNPSDGCPEILQGSGDGTLQAFSGSGEKIAGWPMVVGYNVAAGPVIAPLVKDSVSQDCIRPQILAGDIEGFVTVLEANIPARRMGPGEMWSSQCDPGRTHLYRREQLPEPREMAGLVDLASLVFAPNPVVGDQGWLRARMGRSGTLTVRLFDTSGQGVWEARYEPAAGEQGDQLSLDLRGVAPGLYVAKITARGGDEEISVLRKLAIVR
ncbi:MAG: hypothetical protein KAY24_10535 [Candidatus Eisenbacteria sp.]|nr:hypothetical protein [Candidatus Eisenbacteria bacterium]